MPLSISSKRLVLRPLNNNDIQDLVEIASHPSVASEVGVLEPTQDSAREYIALRNTHQPFEEGQVFDLAIKRRCDGKVVGLLTVVTKKHQKVEIGYALGFDYRGVGYATEAASAFIDHCFSERQIHRVQAIASSGNPASVSVMERLGMVPEGRLREANLRDGVWCDLLYYGILAREWQA